MKIMLFGGSFDPPHLGHQQMVKQVLENKITDQVWYVPCAKHPFAKKMSPSHHRLNMLKLIKNHKTRIKTYELNKAGSSYSYETMLYYQKKMPKNHFSWLIGSDQLSSFHKWNNYQKLLEQFPVYIYPRKNYPMKILYPGMITIKNVEQVDIASRKIRQNVKLKKSISKEVNYKIDKYIKNKKLYL